MAEPTRGPMTRQAHTYSKAVASLDESRLPDGVVLTGLQTNHDDRGGFTEIWRREWETRIDPPQWNAVESGTGVLRGVHVHVRHDDYLVIVAGRAVVGMHDLRPWSPTEGTAAVVTLTPGAAGISIPSGVAHGFCFLEPSIHVYAVSHYFDPADELGCRFDDPALGIDWPVADPRISPRDDALGSLAELRDEYVARSAPS